MAFLGDPVQRFLTWASTPDAGFAHEGEVAARIRTMAEELGSRIDLAAPIGFDTSLVAAARAFHSVAAGAVREYDEAWSTREESPGAPYQAMRSGSEAIIAAIPALQAAVGAFSRQHEASAAGLICRRVFALMELAVAGELVGPDSFLGGALVRMPLEESLWGNLAAFEEPDGYERSVARLRQIAGQIGQCTTPDGAGWAVAEQERSYATENNVLLFVTPDGVPHTGDGDPASPHILLAASPTSLLIFVKGGAQ